MVWRGYDQQDWHKINEEHRLQSVAALVPYGFPSAKRGGV